MKYILVLDNVNGKPIELTKPINWNSVTEAKQLCYSFETGGKKLAIRLSSKPKKKTIKTNEYENRNPDNDGFATDHRSPDILDRGNECQSFEPETAERKSGI